jgi:hypothetical protein
MRCETAAPACTTISRSHTIHRDEHLKNAQIGVIHRKVYTHIARDARQNKSGELQILQQQFYRRGEKSRGFRLEHEIVLVVWAE